MEWNKYIIPVGIKFREQQRLYDEYDAEAHEACYPRY